MSTPYTRWFNSWPFFIPNLEDTNIAFWRGHINSLSQKGHGLNHLVHLEIAGYLLGPNPHWKGFCFNEAVILGGALWSQLQMYFPFLTEEFLRTPESSNLLLGGNAVCVCVCVWWHLCFFTNNDAKPTKTTTNIAQCTNFFGVKSKKCNGLHMRVPTSPIFFDPKQVTGWALPRQEPFKTDFTRWVV